MALTAFVMVLGLVAAVMPRGQGRVAVIGAPSGGFSEASAIVGAAGGAVVSGGGVPWIVIADGARDADAFVSDLYAAGAWAVLDAEAAQGCLPFLTRRAMNSEF